MRADYRIETRLAGRVPAVREGDQRPSQSIVIGSLRGAPVCHQIGDEILWRNGCDRRVDGVEQSFEFRFTHRTLRVRAENVAKLLFFRIEQIAQIVPIQRARAGLVTEMLTRATHLTCVGPKRVRPIANRG